MRNHYPSLAIALALTLGGSVSYAAPQRIIIEDEKPLEIYALGASNKVGVYKLNPTDLSNPTILGRGPAVQYTGTSVGGGGTFIDPETVVGVKYNYACYSFEATAAGTDEGPWVHSYYAANYNIPGKIYDMTYDESTGDIFCWCEQSFTTKYLAKYDREAHTLSRVGSAPSVNIYALAADGDGQLWGLGTYGMIYKIDKVTGEAEDVTAGAGSRAQFQTNIPMSAAIDPASGMMYIVGRAGTYDTYGSMMKVNLSDFSVENLGALDGYYNSLYIAGSGIADGAPASAEDLSAVFNGSKTVVTFTAPTKNHGGGTLSGELDYVVSADGEEVASGKVNAGATENCELDLSDGNHEISVVISNADGSGKPAKTTLFSGFDVPGNISALKATVDGSKVNLTWEAPSGVNGGMLDMSKLRYAVKRGSEEVASDLEVTVAEDEVTGKIKEYIYTVTVLYGETVGEKANISVFAGEPYDLPYALDLNSIESFGEAGVMVIDPNTGNSAASPTWTLDKVGDQACAVSNSTLYFNRTEFLFLPPAKYSASATYTLSFKAAANGTNAYNLLPIKLRVLIADEPTGDEAELTDLYTDELDNTKNYIEIASKANEYEWSEFEVSFSVAEDGVYSLGIEDFAKFYEANAALAVKDFAISVHYPTPANVSELTAKVQEDNNRNIDLSFKLPTHDTEGAQLLSLSKVEIYRGSKLIDELSDDLTPGAVKTYTDEFAPRGFQNYHVVAYNGTSASGHEYTTLMSGYLNNLMITSISAPEEVIPVDGEGQIMVTVINDGFEQVLEGAYNVNLLCDGVIVDSHQGSALKSDEEAVFTFDIPWTSESPAKATYKAEIAFDGDENTADNGSDEVLVEFKPKYAGLDQVSTSDVAVKAYKGTIIVEGAEGMSVNVFSANGLEVAGISKAPAKVCIETLQSGVYIVRVGSRTFKLTI